jgi:molecular chaperone DnaJ
VLTVQEHPVFRRDGPDLQCIAPVTIGQAVLGADIDVPTLDGTTVLSVPAGTQSGKTFCVRGHGMPRLGGGGRGDLYVVTLVRIPSQLSRKQREMFEELRAIEDPADVPARDLFERVKDIFS